MYDGVVVAGEESGEEEGGELYGHAEGCEGGGRGGEHDRLEGLCMGHSGCSTVSNSRDV